uniref:Permease n=1 Tax=Sphingopyxis macrogoltabida TaxID=33050 RepID=A9ZLZ9_SPHMC|nr:permease [Sphingopyxis macrogoltabida]
MQKLVPEAGAQELPSRNDNPSLGGSVVGKPKLPFGTRISYGIGHMAFGIKSNGFDYYLLAYYSQVLGLDARLVGMALLISLVFDAVSDPIVGYWSDNTESRWGRRHPFLFASAIPVSLSFLLVWSPPEGWSELAMVGYLLVLSIIIRTAISFFETPNVALAPELTEDYTERSKLISLGHFFAWSGGNLMNVAMFFVVFPMFASAAMSEAVSLRKPYEIYGMLASALILVAILIAAFGTQSRIPYLNQAPPKRNITLRLISKEIFETLSNRAFLAVFLAAILGAVALGLKASLHLYFVSYFWEFTASETGYLPLGIFVSAAIGFALAPVATRHLGKKRAAIILGMVAFLAHPIPICLRLLDLLPPNGDPFIFWFNLIFGIVDLGLIICFNILVASMLADLAEQSELETGRRSEGVLAASITFAKKSVQGLGILIASFVLYLASFPRQVDASAVPDEAIWSLGAYYVPIVTGIYLVMLAVLMNYNISRESHEENLRELKMRAAASGPESPKYDAHPDAGSDGKGAAAGK